MEEPPLTLTFGFLLMDTARQLRQVSERSVERNGFGLTPGAIRTLGYVMRYEGSRQAVLADRMDIEPMTLSAFVDRLEKLGLVERRPDPSDRRAKLVFPTPRAVEVVIELDPTFEELYRLVTQGVDQEEMNRIAAVLRKLRANLTSDPSITAPFSLLPAGPAPLRRN